MHIYTHASAQAAELRDLDLRVAADVSAMAAAASRPLTRADVALIKWLLAAASYPRFAMPDEHNPRRREPDCRFHTANVPDLVIHPGSACAGNSNAMSPQVSGERTCVKSVL
jgi:hypothetical protein